MTEQTDRIFFARLSDMAELCRRNGTASFSNFLDERQAAEAERWCRRNTGELHYCFYGGFDGAGRKILSVYPDYYDDYIIEEIPIKCLSFSYRKEDRLTHRDFLGSFMGLMLKRDTIGDIIITDGFAQAAVTEVAARSIMLSLSKVGRTGVKVTDEKGFELSLTEMQKFREISGTVASMRLDCIVALAANVSREKAVSLIRSDKVDVNHFTVSSVSSEVHEGDILSVRGNGRFILSCIDGTTKKNRIHIIIKKFI